MMRLGLPKLGHYPGDGSRGQSCGFSGGSTLSSSGSNAQGAFGSSSTSLDAPWIRPSRASLRTSSGPQSRISAARLVGIGASAGI
jgi:hypothetical protein